MKFEIFGSIDPKSYFGFPQIKLPISNIFPFFSVVLLLEVMVLMKFESH